MAQLLLATELADSWRLIAEHLGKRADALSLSYPVWPRAGRRAVIPNHKYSARALLRSRVRATARYGLKTDITRFYGSVYTHSIPWAMDGKLSAKRRSRGGPGRRKKTLGDRLDDALRAGQDRQSVGIPIGPDSLLLLAEILLTPIDQVLKTNFGAQVGFRYVDDYELAFETRTEAEDALAFLEGKLAHFELALNPRKTELLELPGALEDCWARELRRFRISDRRGQQLSDLISFFSLAFEHFEATNEAPVLAYALARMRHIELHRANWMALQNLLAQCAMVEPAVLHRAVVALTEHGDPPGDCHTDLWERVFDKVIRRCAPLMRDSEIAWSLWGAMALKLKLPATCAEAVSNYVDPFVALLPLDAEERGCFSGQLGKSTWQGQMTTEGLDGPFWPLVYEAGVRKWLPNADGDDHIKGNAAFQLLRKNKVKLYDQSKVGPFVPAAAEPMPGHIASPDLSPA